MDTAGTHLSPRETVVIADDHPVVLEGLKRLLSDDFDVCATVGNGHDLMDAVHQIKPDVVLTDLAMPGLDGIEVARRLHAEGSSTRVIAVTMHDEPERALEAFAAGMVGYVLKGTTGVELRRAIHEVLEGRTYLSSDIALGVMSSLMEGGPGSSELTRRQKEVLRLVAEGHSLKAMARILGISRRTVESHKYELMRKLHVSSTAELVLSAMRLRMIQDPLSSGDDKGR